MTIDLERMLRRVVEDVFGGGVSAVYTVDPKGSPAYRVELSGDDQRRARLRVTYEWFEVSIPDLAVGAFLLDYDDDESEKERVVRELALVAKAYLDGEGTIETKRGLLRTVPVLTVRVNGRDWRLGRRTSQPHYPSRG
jgi:hypothetical protein